MADLLRGRAGASAGDRPAIGRALEHARLYERERQAVQARDEVLGVVAHDLRNPLGAISLYASILEESFPPEDRSRSHAQTILNLCNQADHLIRDLLDVSRIEAGQLRVEPLSVPVRGLLASADDLSRTGAEEKGIDLRVEVMGDPPLVLADADRISQVFSNLIGNAIRFTPSGGRIQVRADVAAREVHFSVSDTGPGIAPDFLPRLFDRYWQVNRTTRAGAGLGLSIVKGIVEAHGGRVWVESELEQGSTFTFSLPSADPGEAEPPPVPEEASGELPFSSDATAFRVLVVDDHPAVRRGLLEVLRADPSVEVVGEASTGEEAVEMADRLRPDVVLMDLEMPGMGGVEAIHRVHDSGIGFQVRDQIRRNHAATSAFGDDAGPFPSLVTRLLDRDGIHAGSLLDTAQHDRGARRRMGDPADHLESLGEIPRACDAKRPVRGRLPRASVANLHLHGARYHGRADDRIKEIQHATAGKKQSRPEGSRRQAKSHLDPHLVCRYHSQSEQ
jgi:CheY-like chemotaxis protein